MTDESIFPPMQATHTLREAFSRSISERLRAIESKWDAVQHNSEHVESHLAAFAEAVHYLAGGAGVHGFTVLTQRAYQILAHVQPALKHNEGLSKYHRFMIGHLVHALIHSADHYNAPGYDDTEHERSLDTDKPGETSSSLDVYALSAAPHDMATLQELLTHVDLHLHVYDSMHSLRRSINNNVPRALLLDLEHLQLEGDDGAWIETLRQKHPSCPAIALSSSGTMETRLQATQIGATHFFVKPIDGYRFVDALHNASKTVSATPPRVLLVDDDLDTSNFIALHLNQEGLDVSVLNNPLNLLETMAQFHPDLILTDLYMPACSGLDLASIVRQHASYFDTPIVFLTSETDETFRLAALQLGCDAFFSKSADIALIAKAVKSRLERMQTYAVVKKAMVWSPG